MSASIPKPAEAFFENYNRAVAGENLLVLYETDRIQSLDIDAAKTFCKSCKVGSHKCSVQTRYGWCCDLCIEEELLALRLCGIHTVGSCCGHGKQELASILVVSEESKAMMRELGYELLGDMPEHRMSNWKPKTKMIYEMEEHQ